MHISLLLVVVFSKAWIIIKSTLGVPPVWNRYHFVRILRLRLLFQYGYNIERRHTRISKGNALGQSLGDSRQKPLSVPSPFLPSRVSLGAMSLATQGEPDHPQKLTKAIVIMLHWLSHILRYRHVMPVGLAPIICLLSTCGHSDSHSLVLRHTKLQLPEVTFLH